MYWTVYHVALATWRATPSFQSQMAIAVIGGLVTSTGLTLVMVPAAFTWMDDLERWLGRKVGRHLDQRRGPTGTPPAGAPQHPIA